MRVLQIFSSGNVSGGAALSMCSLAEELATAYNVEIIVLVPHTTSRETMKRLHDSGIEVHEARLPWITYPPLHNSLRNSARALFRKAVAASVGRLSDVQIMQLIKNRNIDLVHICDGVVETGALSAKKCSIPLIWHIREYVEEDHGHKYVHRNKTYRAYANATKVVCISKALTEHYRTRIPDASIATVYNGVATKREINELTARPIKRSKNDTETSILFLGGIRESKGTLDALRALAKIHSLHEFSFTFDIYGGAADEDIREFHRLLDSSGLNDVVHYYGWQQMPLEKIASYDIQLVCSRSEAFGRITAESMCAHTVVVGADSGGTTELIENDRGYLYESGNVESLTNALLSALKDTAERMRIADEAASFAREHFTIEEYGKNIFALYQQVLGSHGNTARDKDKQS